MAVEPLDSNTALHRTPSMHLGSFQLSVKLVGESALPGLKPQFWLEEGVLSPPCWVTQRTRSKRVGGLGLQQEFGVDLLFGRDLVPRHLTGEVFHSYTPRKTRTPWRDPVSGPAWEHLHILLDLWRRGEGGLGVPTKTAASWLSQTG